MSHDALAILFVFAMSSGFIGAMAMIGGWTFCRKPGVRFWKLYSPIWRWREFVTQTGFYLWAGGISAMFFGWVIAGFILVVEKYKPF